MNIILGITGGIAAYKSVTLLRELRKSGHDVQVVITPAGRQFITPVTLSALSQHPVVCDFFAANTGEWHSHVDLGVWADLMIIAPATASTIAKMAHGVADNMLVTTYLSAKCPVWLAPAMDLDMMAHPTTRHNLELLRSYGNRVIEPETGYLASGLVGKGRMEEPEKIAALINEHFQKGQELAGKEILVTAGPTHEKIDPVRFIGNYSTGKMGYAIAEEAARRGAKVTIISGPVSLTATHPNITVVDVESAQQMYDAAMRRFPQADIAIMCAAVADYAPVECAEHKIKREHDEIPVIRLKKNPDIAAALGKIKCQGQTLVGFALETDNAIENATEKIARKNLDMIVVNSLADPGAGFATDTNKVTIMKADGQCRDYPLKPKSEVAADILDNILAK